MTGASIRVQRIKPTSGGESWTVVTAESFVDPAERFLAHLVDIDRSPKTVRAYARDLRDYFEYLHGRGLQWDQVRLEDIGRFVAWLRLPFVTASGCGLRTATCATSSGGRFR